MTEPSKRAVEMLRIAASYIREHCPEETIFYDDATCDGGCVADDCEFARYPANNPCGSGI